ncbi:hypothetical protein ACFPZ0_15705 [Streptomonospora nanhaiensis]|uniref:hypothetical protein n=1 Tax=Streptomonospora nanhaiensis TaxID=1323731 RepID=UPI001C381E8E|nr:hypothetical protein [Streptomonospora nanhaiensis]MBV2363386.1 hypothetical protein [Streptomonospora nanhaiensis]MBX9389714.1 hypothetical protein [Streptomonospora nanhaiensis]
MRRVAITGHRELPAEVERAVAGALRDRLRHIEGPVTGLSCLADGADTLFARAVLEHGGALEAVVPAERYRDGLPAGHRAVYDELLAAAVLVHHLPHVESTPQAHLEAGRYLVEHCDELMAVWDGRPPRGPGGTADIVDYARRQHRAVTVVWPEGARR